jgi:hypothetical protein
MSKWFGTSVIIDENVICIEPLPKYAQDFFKAYAKALKEVYHGKRARPAKKRKKMHR